MGSACSTPHLDTDDPPLEILILSDGSYQDAAIINFLHQHRWLHQSSLLQRRLPPKQIHRNHQDKVLISANHQHHRNTSSSASQQHRINLNKTSSNGAIKPVTAQQSLTVKNNSNQKSRTLTSSSSSSSSSSQSSHSPMIYFLCDNKPFSVRFHLCPDYQQPSKRRASTLQRQTKPHPISHNVRRPSAQTSLFTSRPIDGCLVFVSNKDAVAASSTVIGGLRPLLKRKNPNINPININNTNNNKGFNKEAVISQVMPFVLIGIEEPKLPASTPSDSPTTSANNNNSVASVNSVQIKPKTAFEESKEPESSPPSLTASIKSNSTSSSSTSTTTNSPNHPVVRHRSSSIGSVSSISRPLSKLDGQSLAKDTGACCFVSVDLISGRGIDDGIRALVKQIEREKEINDVKDLQ